MHPNFTLAEFVASATAASRHIDNTLPPELVPVAQQTLELLQRIRNHLSAHAGHDVPVHITSGYRSMALNLAIGSTGNSDHPRAMAADWTAPSFGTPSEICRHLAPLVGELGIGQLINEYPDRAGHGWVHTSTRMPERVANRVITITTAGVSAGVTEA